MGPILLTWRTCSLPSWPAAPPGALSPRPPKHPGSPQWEPVSSTRTSHGAASAGVPQHPPGPGSAFLLCWLFMDDACSNPRGFQVHPSMMSPTNPGQPCRKGTHPGWGRGRRCGLAGPDTGYISHWGLSNFLSPPCFSGPPTWGRGPAPSCCCLPSILTESLCSCLFCLNLESKYSL